MDAQYGGVIVSSATLLEELKTSANLKIWHNLRKYSLLDQSGNGFTLTPGGTGAEWKRGFSGQGLSGTIDTAYSATTSATLDFTAGTVFYAVQYHQTPAAYLNHTILSKSTGPGFLINGYTCYISAGAANFSLGDAVGFQAFGAIALTPGKEFFIVHSWDGSWIKSYGNGLLIDTRAQTRIPTSVGQTYRYGWSGATFGLHDAILYQGGAINRVLTGSEVAQLWTDFLTDRCAKDLPRRGFIYKYPSKNNTEYTAANIVLDTGFESEMSGATRRIKDFTNNYPGTLTGITVPGQNGEGMKSGVNLLDEANFGDVTQLNSATKFTLEFMFELAPTNMIGEYLLAKRADASHVIGLYTGAWSTSILYVEIANGIVNVPRTNDTVLRAGFKHHIMVTYDGTKTTDAEKLQVDAGGENYAMTYPATVIAALANLVGIPLYIPYNGHATPGTYLMARLYAATALNPTQRREAYVQNAAKRLLLRETLEDVPVSLVASVGAGGKIGPWDVISGTWKCSETSDGKRWLECVTAGCAVCLQPHTFGTFEFIFQKASLGTGLYVTFNANARDTLAAGQTGYVFASDAGDRAGIYRYPGFGAMFYSGGGYIAAATPYRVTLNRRVSDGRFMGWIKGGVYTNNTLISAAGSGSNPSAAEATYTSSAWVSVTFAAGDKLCLYDPRDPTVAFNVFAGALNPTLGEVPGSNLLNMLRWSEQFDNAAWTKTNTTVAPNTTASPFGSPFIADLITATVGGSLATIRQLVTVNPLAQYTRSIYVHASVGTSFIIHMSDNVTGECRATFDPTTGALTTLTPGAVYGNVSAGSESIGSGWWRYWLSGSQPAAQTALNAYLTLINNADAIYVWGAQLVQGPCAGSYRETQ